MMKKIIAVLPGDGVGPEVVRQAILVLKKIAKKFNHFFTFNFGLIGAQAINQVGNPLPKETLILCKNSEAILFGAVGDPKYDYCPNIRIRPEQGLLKLRKALKLYANLRPIKVYKELIDVSPIKAEKIKDVDFIIVRELTGGIYFGRPQERRDNGYTAVDTSIYNRQEIVKVTKIALNIALKRRKKITSVDKANVLETSRLWRETVTNLVNSHQEVELNHMFIDNAAMQIIKNPSQFDIILIENMFGDILSDEASVIVGSIGMLPSASIGDQYALYEPIHGAYNKAAGKNIANPIGTILSVAMMLRLSFNLEEEATAIENAITKVLSKNYRTKDIASYYSLSEKILGTKEMGEMIINSL